MIEKGGGVSEVTWVQSQRQKIHPAIEIHGEGQPKTQVTNGPTTWAMVRHKDKAAHFVRKLLIATGIWLLTQEQMRTVRSNMSPVHVDDSFDWIYGCECKKTELQFLHNFLGAFIYLSFNLYKTRLHSSSSGDELMTVRIQT